MKDWTKDYEITPGIFEFKDHLSEEICNEVLTYYENSPLKIPGRTQNGIDVAYKNTTDCGIEDPQLVQKIGELFIGVLQDYVFRKYPVIEEMGALELGIPQIQYYKKGEGMFLPHYDTNIFEPEERILAIIVYLNDVEAGGETYFHYKNLYVKPERGKMIVFDPSWQNYHEGKVPISNDKYIFTHFLFIKTR